MTKTQHTHKFKRLKYKSGNTIFFCALPDCSQKINISLALGKRSICWRCGEPFVMTEYSLRLAKPHCEACHKPKNDILSNKLNEAMNNNTLIAVNDKRFSLAERLEQTIQQAQEQTEQEEEEI